MFLKSSKFYMHWNLHLTMISRYCRHHLGMALCGVKVCVVRCARMVCLEPQLERRRVLRHGSVATELPGIPCAFDFWISFCSVCHQKPFAINKCWQSHAQLQPPVQGGLALWNCLSMKMTSQVLHVFTEGLVSSTFMEKSRLCCGVK